MPVRSESRREGARGATPLSSATVASGSRGFVAASGASDASSGGAGGGSTVAKSSLPLGLTDTLASSETFFAASAGASAAPAATYFGGKKLAMFAAFTGVGFLADIEVRGRSGTLLGSCAVVPHARVNAPEACGKAVDISNPSRERLNSRFRLSDWTSYGVTYLGGPTRGEIEPRRARGAPRLSTTPSFADSPPTPPWTGATRPPPPCPRRDARSGGNVANASVGEKAQSRATRPSAETTSRCVSRAPTMRGAKVLASRVARRSAATSLTLPLPIPHWQAAEAFAAARQDDVPELVRPVPPPLAPPPPPRPPVRGSLTPSPPRVSARLPHRRSTPCSAA